MPISFNHTERVHLYRQEQGAFRQLSLITKSVASYLLKLVDKAGGWLPLDGRTPWDAVRIAAPGECGQSDRRILKRAIRELLEEGYLELGVMVEGELLPCEGPDAEYLAIRNWVPAQQGHTRSRAIRWQAERRARAQHCAEGEHCPENPDSARTERGPSVDRVCTERGLSPDRARTEKSVTTRNSNGMKLAVIPYHTIPYRKNPLPPLGDSLSRLSLQGARSSPIPGESADDDAPSPAQLDAFAQSVIGHLNAKVGRKFKADGANLRQHLGALMRTGVTLEQCYAVIDAKCAEWTRPQVAAKMACQLKPDVLLRPENFRRYLENDVDTGTASASRPGRDLMADLDRRRAAGELL